MKKILLRIFTALVLLSAFTVSATIRISEFMALNDKTLKDEDGNFSDWIELKNTSSNAINLIGWYLTDDANKLNKWQFPSTNILPGAYLIIFASDKDRSTTGSELHTNFKLSGSGEYLAIVEADGQTIAHEYAPSFPPQLDNLSYGFASETADLTLIDDEAPCTARVPTDASEGTSWQLTGFNDSAWTTGLLGVGYEKSSGYESLFNLDLLEEMYGINASAYIRVPFVIPAGSSVLSLALRMKYDDGFIAYINGVKVVASANVPAIPTWNSAATVIHSDNLAKIFVSYDISDYKHLLVTGQNTLAIHALNYPKASTDFLIVPRLECRIETDATSSTAGYLEAPTPGTANSAEMLLRSEPVVISVLGRLCSGPVTVQLFAPESAEKIYYTMDGSEPSLTSAAYTGPITISSTTSLRARSFQTGLALGPISTETYIFLDSSVQTFNSNLPIVIVDNLGGGDIPDLSSQSAFLAFFEQGSDGRTRMTNNFVLSSRAGIRRRGETSKRATNLKPNLAIETWGASANDDMKIAPLGMPSESDWILWAPWHFDPAGLRNALIYELSNQTDNYAVRTRFVEVFLNSDGGNVTMADYAGLYLFEEKIKRGNDRVDVESITPFDNAEPAVTGGYILRIDKEDPGQKLLTGMIQTRLYCIYPQPENITIAQENYISNYIIDFEAQLSNPDPLTGYQAYIDTGDFIDHFMLNLLTKNADGLVFSTYMHKPRNGKLSMGPIWDFDRSQESTDDRDDDPLGWKYTTYNWWKTLFKNADFWQQYIDRWQELRGNVLSDTNLTAVIDMMAAEIAEAKVRDIARWAGVSNYTSPRSGSNGLDGTQQGEVNYMKWWLTTRMDWMDTQLIAAPTLSHTGGAIATPIQLTITAPTGTTVYYTLDGSDPRAPGGLPSSSATAYTGAVTIQPESCIQARAWNNTAWGFNPPSETPWSGPITAIYPQGGPTLFLTEVHYNPATPDPAAPFESSDFEFIELQNMTQATLNLRGYSLNEGIDFAFSDSSVELLPPGGYVVVVRNRAAFASRYNTNGMAIAGEYSGKLSNSGENIRLEFYGQKIFEITYDNARGWPMAADGGGSSLIPMTATVTALGFDILDYPDNWRASTYIGGSPGEADPEGPESIIINELTAHTDTGLEPPFDSNDQIEIFNPTDASFILDSYWYLSDNLSDLKKWNIPGGTTIPPRGWVVFDENDFHPGRTSGFGLDKAGETLTLSHLPVAEIGRVVDCVAFKGQANGASLGRYPDGNRWFQALTPTPGTANQLAPPGIHIQEMIYNPWPGAATNADELLEYILLTNASSASISFDGGAETTNTWRLAGGVDYRFESERSMLAGERLWLIPFDPETDQESKTLFCITYGLNAGSEQFAGPYTGKLSNSGERIALERPQAGGGAIDPDNISWMIVDEMIWLDKFPWPYQADGTGLALRRIDSAGNDPLSWTITDYSGSRHSITSEKSLPEVSTWDGFTTIPNLSSIDYADMNSSNDVTVTIPMGDLMFPRSASKCLINSRGQSSVDDFRNAISYANNGPGRICMDLQKVIPVHEINTYSWKPGSFQNQNYDLYYSSANYAPDASSYITDLTAEGWVLLESVQTVYDESTAGQIGVSITSRFGEPLAYARHLLWDIKAGSTYYGEFDIFMTGSFVTNNVPEAWLINHGLAPIDSVAMADIDGDGLLTWEEFYAGTNPRDALSVLRITDSATGGSEQLLQWKAVAGKTYSIEFKSNLTDSAWSVIESGIPGVAPLANWSLPITGERGFIRIKVE